MTSPNPFDPSLPADGEPLGDDAPVAPGDLSAFDAEFTTTQAASSDEVPDGKYQVRVNKVSLSRSQKNDPMIKWDLIVIAGPHTGRHIFKNSVITQAALPFVKGDLQTLGLQLPKLSDLPQHLESLLDLNIEVTRRTKGEYTNVYFNKLLQLAPGALGTPGEADLSGQPAPF
jgi:hypothetical protein